MTKEPGVLQKPLNLTTSFRHEMVPVAPDFSMMSTLIGQHQKYRQKEQRLKDENLGESGYL